MCTAGCSDGNLFVESVTASEFVFTGKFFADQDFKVVWN